MAGYIGSKVAVVSSGAERKKVFTATSGQTSFTGLSYTVNNVHVFQNGVRLVDGTDYTATNGNSITLTVGAATDDQVVVVSYNTFQTSDTVSASAGGTFSNAVTIDADGSTVLTVDRATSDGTIIDLQKSGSSVGSIGTKNGALHIGSTTGSDSYLGFYSNSIIPTTSDGSDRNNAIDLGYTDSRFKDLYLSGGVYLGGTGAANKLDDYESGSFSASGNWVTNNNKYIKVGDLVTITMDLVGPASGSHSQFNLPFTANATSAVAIYTTYVGFSGGRTYATAVVSGGVCYLRQNGGGVQFAALNVGAGHVIHFSLSYYTTQ